MKYIQKVDNLIALIKIFDKYEEFMGELEKLRNETHYDIDSIIYYINKISNKKVFGKKKIKEFYEKNKIVIDTINQYTSIYNFFSTHLYYYRFEGENSDIKYFYDYISEHKEQLYKIEELLQKMYALDVGDLKIDSNLDLSDKIYSIRYYDYGDDDISFPDYSLIYLANMELVPNCEDDILKYRTINSPYKLELKANYFKENVMTVNSLLLNPELLPNEPLDMEEVANDLIKQKKQMQSDYDTFKDIINFEFDIGEINRFIKYISDRIDKIDDPKVKKYLNKVLQQTKQKIKLFQEETVNYYSSKIDDVRFLDKNVKAKELNLKSSRYYDCF